MFGKANFFTHYCVESAYPRKHSVATLSDPTDGNNHIPALGSQVFRDCATQATRAQHMAETVDHLTKIDRVLRAVIFDRGINDWISAHSASVSSPTRVTQRTAVIAKAAFDAPNRDVPGMSRRQ